VSYCLNSPNPASCFGYTRIYTPEQVLEDARFWVPNGVTWITVTVQGWYEGPNSGAVLVWDRTGAGFAVGGVEVVDYSAGRAVLDALKSRSSGGGTPRFGGSAMLSGDSYSVGVEIDDSIIRQLTGQNQGIKVVYESRARIDGGRQGFAGVKVTVDIRHRGLPDPRLVAEAAAAVLILGGAAVSCVRLGQCSVPSTVGG
jgi:hypothetical protein